MDGAGATGRDLSYVAKELGITAMLVALSTLCGGLAATLTGIFGSIAAVFVISVGNRVERSSLLSDPI